MIWWALGLAIVIVGGAVLWGGIWALWSIAQ